MRTSSASPNADGIRRVENKRLLATPQFESGMQVGTAVWCAHSWGSCRKWGIVIGPSKFV
jgi:hypothetical protein